MKVLKFGGSSVAKPERIRLVIQIVKSQPAVDRNVLVFSAFGGVTDVLIRMSEEALVGDKNYVETLHQLEQRHVDAVRSLIGIQRQNSTLATVKTLMHELEDVLHGIYLVKERTPRMLDFVMSFGERLSAFIISEAMMEEGLAVKFLDARSVIRTDSNFGYGKVDFKVTNRQINDYLKLHNETPVVTGFIASCETGETTTLGRSGSDYTAAIFAGALNASSVEIWTDVDGMMTADPRKVRRAFTVPEMTYHEAMELSHFGAKVIFPATMKPAMVNQIPIWIKNTFNPEFAGTVIRSETNGKDLIIKGISSMSHLALLSVQGAALQGVVGVSMRLFGSLARSKVNVILISQASSEHSICLAVDQSVAVRARQSIEQEFQLEISNGDMDVPIVENDRAIVAIVGENMRNNPGTSGRMFHALGKSGVNVYAIAQGSSELNISAVIRSSDVSKALNVLHESFFLSDKRFVNVFLVGTGLIGKELLKMIQTQYDVLAEQHRLEVHVVGLSNSRRMIFDERGLPLAEAVERLDTEGERMELSVFIERMSAMNLSNSIFVDCTANEMVTEAYEAILESSVSIVTPNKKANSGSLEKYHRLKRTSARRGVRFLYETNVGAGLPVISTLNDLLLSGDKVIRVEAVLSGTMNFIFSAFDGTRPFSSIVAEARQNGFTEPDPRDDLNGMDVARKILILAREAGIDLELTDIDVQNLVPPDCAKQEAVADFLHQLTKHDDAFDQLRKEAESNQQRLRFMAVLEQGKASVSLGSVGVAHPFYSLRGSDNIILLTTERYRDRPMVIRGPGAGAEVTAAGVFADIIRIGNYAVR